MKQRTLVRSIAAATAVLAILPLLGGCGQSLAKASKPLPASQAFALEGIWYYVDTDDEGQVVADDDVEAIIEVDNKGNAKWYQLNLKKEFPISSLERMKPEQVLEYAKKTDEELFAQHKQTYLDSANNELADAQEFVDTHKERLDDIEENYTSVLEQTQEAIEQWSNTAFEDTFRKKETRVLAEKENKIKQENTAYEEKENIVDVAQQVVKEAKAIKYSEPKAQQLKLQIVPDATGSSTESEYLLIEEVLFNAEPKIAVNTETNKLEYRKFMGKQTKRCYLRPLSYTQVVGSLGFGGYEVGDHHALVTSVDQKHAGFILDQPDVKAENASIKKDE